MKKPGFIGACAFGLVLYGMTATAQDFGRYRAFELGSAVATVSMLTGVAESELKSLHQRPAPEWGNESSSVALHRRSTYAIGFTLMVTAEPVAALARTAAARAIVLDAREAPQREAARQKKEADDRRAAEEKARSINKPIFRP